MSLILNLEKHNPKSQDRDIPEIEFLKSSELCDVVTRGLTELYKVQPKTPVTFLANWLMNESRSKEILKRVR